MDAKVWGRDKCTCGHEDIVHEDYGKGSCKICLNEVSYGQGTICTRYQWNGEPRLRIW